MKAIYNWLGARLPTLLKNLYYGACHLIVPLVFLSVAFLHYRDRTFLRWELVAILVLACLPFILPLLRIYRVKSLGKDGIGFDGDVGPQPAGPGEQELFTSDLKLATKTDGGAPEKKKLGDFSRFGRKVLRTLWKYQRTQFGDDYSKRWGFGISPLADDFRIFEAGCEELRRDGLIQDRGNLVYLTDSGIVFCREFNLGLEGGGDTWDKFGSE